MGVGEENTVHSYVARENEMLSYDMFRRRHSKVVSLSCSPANHTRSSITCDIKAVSCAKGGRKEMRRTYTTNIRVLDLRY